MPAIVSLERFNCMSEHTPDDFSELSSEQAADEIASVDNTPSQATPPEEGEPPLKDEEAPPIEQSDKDEVPSSPENALPPEAQGEANGGPLGCCLGTMVGLLLSLSLAIFSRFFADSLVAPLQGNYWLLGLIVRILMGVLAFALAILFGYLGWRLGKRFYREYDPPVSKRGSRSGKAHQKV